MILFDIKYLYFAFRWRDTYISTIIIKGFIFCEMVYDMLENYVLLDRFKFTILKIPCPKLIFWKDTVSQGRLKNAEIQNHRRHFLIYYIFIDITDN